MNLALPISSAAAPSLRSSAIVTEVCAWGACFPALADPYPDPAAAPTVAEAACDCVAELAWGAMATRDARQSCEVWRAGTAHGEHSDLSQEPRTPQRPAPRTYPAQTAAARLVASVMRQARGQGALAEVCVVWSGHFPYEPHE